MKRTLSIKTINKIGELVRLNGWVHARRDLGKIAFIGHSKFDKYKSI